MVSAVRCIRGGAGFGRGGASQRTKSHAGAWAHATFQICCCSVRIELQTHARYVCMALHSAPFVATS